MIQRYLGKISGPLLDRIDIHIEVPAVPYKELRGERRRESLGGDPRARGGARAVQQARGYYNAHMPARDTAQALRARRLPASGRSKWPSGAWACRPARTTGSSRWRARSPIWTRRERLAAKHLAEAVQYRSLDRNYWT